MKIKNIVIGLIVIVLIAFVVNELRFFIWPSFGVPELPTMPNCGERRFKYDLQIKSKEDFLNVMDELRKIEPREPGDPVYIIAQNFRLTNFTLNDISVRNSGSLIFTQKLYSVHSCGRGLVVEISENGYASERGCCGI